MARTQRDIILETSLELISSDYNTSFSRECHLELMVLGLSLCLCLCLSLSVRELQNLYEPS